MEESELNFVTFETFFRCLADKLKNSLSEHFRFGKNFKRLYIIQQNQ